MPRLSVVLLLAAVAVASAAVLPKVIPEGGATVKSLLSEARSLERVDRDEDSYTVHNAMGGNAKSRNSEKGYLEVKVFQYPQFDKEKLGIGSIWDGDGKVSDEYLEQKEEIGQTKFHDDYFDIFYEDKNQFYGKNKVAVLKTFSSADYAKFDEFDKNHNYAFTLNEKPFGCRVKHFSGSHESLYRKTEYLTDVDFIVIEYVTQSGQNSTQKENAVPSNVFILARIAWWDDSINDNIYAAIDPKADEEVVYSSHGKGENAEQYTFDGQLLYADIGKYEQHGNKEDLSSKFWKAYQKHNPA